MRSPCRAPARATGPTATPVQTTAPERPDHALATTVISPDGPALSAMTTASRARRSCEAVDDGPDARRVTDGRSAAGGR